MILIAQGTVQGKGMLKNLMECQYDIIKTGLKLKIYPDSYQLDRTSLKIIFCLISFQNILLKHILGCIFVCLLIQKNLPSFNDFSLRRLQ